MPRRLVCHAVLLLVLVGSLATLTAQGLLPQAAGTGTISGVVVDAVSGALLAGARVSLRRVDTTGQPGPRMVTDAKGRFIFANLAAAKTHYLDASRFGYAATRYGWSAPGGSSAISAIRQIAVDDGQWVSDIRIPLWRLGSISGRVVDERGEPVVGVAVRVYSTANIAGRHQLAGGNIATTDDRGVYRIADLSPGKYIVSVLSVQSTVLNTTPEVGQLRAVGELATGGIGGGNGAVVASPGVDVDGRHRLVLTNFATPPPPNANQSRAYPAVFYPAASTAADAMAIDINYGDSREAVDFQLMPVAAVRVSGRVDAGTRPIPRFLLRLLPKGSEPLGFGAEAATTQIEPNGEFTFLNVPAGEYTLMAQGAVMDFTTGDSFVRLPDAPGFPAGGISVGSKRGAPDMGYLLRSGQSEPAWGRLSVSVGASDIADMVVPLHAAAKIRGHLLFAEGVTPPAATRPMIMFAQPVNGDPSLGNPNGRTQPNDATFAFTIDGLLAGTYLIDSMTFAAMAPISVMWDGRDVKDTGFDGTLGRDFDDVVVTLTDKLAEIAGVVRDGQTPGPAAVMAFPVERERWTNFGWEPLRLQSAPAGMNGTYKLQRLPEGDYFVIAVPSTQGRAWLDPKFLAAAAPLASRLSIKWGEKASIDLKLTPVAVK